MTDHRLYTAVLPSGTFKPTSGRQDVAKQLTKLAGLDGTGSVTATGTQPGGYRVDGQYKGKYAERATTELRELLEADALESVVLYGVGAPTPEDGYYTTEGGSTSRAAPQTPAVINFDGDLSKEGTRRSHCRAIRTDAKQRSHPWGNDTTGYVGIPATASKVQWLTYIQDDTQSATADDTVSAEFGDVDRFDVESAPSGFGDRPYLAYDVPYAEEGNTDAAVFDTHGDPRTDTDGDFAWTQVFKPDHNVQGDLLLSNGRLRVTLDEASNTLTAERWDDANSQWADVSLNAADWQLFDADLTHPGAAQVRARLTFENSTNGNLFDLAAVLHRGWEDLLLYSPDDLQVPSALVTRLDPIAAATVIDPQPERTLLDRSVLR